MRVVIRADGGPSLGMGHIIRCLALAEMLQQEFSIVFAIQEPKNNIIQIIHSVTKNILLLPSTTDFSQDALNLSAQLHADDIVVLDGYEFKTEYQEVIRGTGCKLVCIDDLHAWKQLADVVINHAHGVRPDEYTSEDHTRFYLGNNYLLLRKPFFTVNHSSKPVHAVKKVFISMGAADTNNITQKFAEALIKINRIEEVHLMIGSVNLNLNSLEKLISETKSLKIFMHINISAEQIRHLLNECDLAICPASSIALESCAVGIGLVSGYTADNQTAILKGLVENKAVIDLHDLNNINAEEITKKLNELIDKPEQLHTLVKNQHQMIDGRSPERILAIFKDLCSTQIHFRPATESDIALYFKWANDPLVRANSYDTDSIAYTSHVNWFRSKLGSPDYSFYLFFNKENIPVGQVRIAKANNETIIGISIDSAFRGKSLGTKMLEDACSHYLKGHVINAITAYIKIENIASYSIFKKAGFENEEIVFEKGFKSYKLHKTFKP